MKNNQANQNTAKKLSFYELFAIENYKIEIPIIQRDYAQGRNTAKSIRSSFLEALYDYLVNNDNSNDLDFVYGSLGGEKNDVFVPLDGQQRLTTLFLLHWYLANKENKCDRFREFMVNGDTSKFSYATRASSGEFCDALVKCQISFNNLLNDSLSNTLKDKPWYFESWDNDPTIIGMFIMLDDIHEKFRSYEESNLYDRLCNSEKPAITFQFLNIETLKLSDDLYIKMNARGKPLTDFENLKAKLEQQIKKLNDELPQYQLHNEKVSASKYFSHKIDTDWANLFWDFRNSKTNTFDAGITNFMRLVIVSHVITKNINDNIVGDLLDSGGSLKELSFLEYERLGCLNAAALADLISFFDAISKGETVEIDSFHYPVKKSFGRVLSSNTSYIEKLRFYAFYSYLIHFQSTEGLDDWMRVIYNLTENSIYNRPEHYVRSIKAIKEMLPYGKDILTFLVDTNNKIEGFTEIQIYEEIVKANLILKCEEWRKVILSIEQYAYFTGQIGFILEFSGIVEYYQKHQNCNWNEHANSEYIEGFKNYSSKAGGLFKLIKESSATVDFLWERAVLTKGDYLIGATSGRCNLLSSRQAKNNIMRDYSWKRLLRLSLQDLKQSKKGLLAKKRGYVKAVFDDATFDVEKLKESLQEICDFALQNHQLKTWQKYFVRDSALMEYCQQGFIRFNSEYDIQLLGQSQLNHYHAEIHSYALYERYIAKHDFYPFKGKRYVDVKSSWEDAYINLYGFVIDDTDYKIEIQYLADKEQYEISFINYSLSDIPKYLEEILISNQMEAVKSYRYIRRESTNNYTITFLKELCEKLSKVNDEYNKDN